MSAPTLGAKSPPHATLKFRTPSSYEIAAGTPEHIASHLTGQGWSRSSGNTEQEQARLRDCYGGLVVLYRNTVLVQGKAARGHAALRELVEVKR